MSMAETEVDSTPETEKVESTSSELEARARRMGWKPKGEYDNRGEFMSAEDYVRKAEEDLPVLRARLRKMDDNYKGVISELNDTKKTFEDFRRFMTNSEKRSYEKARRELVDKRNMAVAHADTEVFNATDKEIEALDQGARELTETRPAPQQAQLNGQAPPPAIDPVAEAWVKENPWFLNDTQLNRAAKIIDSELLQEAPGVPTAERLATVKAEVVRMYPDKFRNPRRSEAASVASPSGESTSRSRSAKGQSYDDLPADAKKACDKFVKTIKGYTRDEYLKNYDWS